MPMQVHLFRGPGRIFAVTQDPAGANLPAVYAPWTPFKSIDIHPDEPQGGMDVNECLRDLADHGVYITDAHVRVPPPWEQAG
jgi:hypothetical protein